MLRFLTVIVFSLSFIPAVQAEPVYPSDRAKVDELIKKHGEPKVGSTQSHTCKLTGNQTTCTYPFTMKGWATDYFKGYCNPSNSIEANNYLNSDDGIDCSTTSLKNGYMEFHCTNWNTHKASLTQRVICKG